MTLTSEYLRRLRQETDIDLDNCIHLLIFVLLRPAMRLARKVVNMKRRRSIRIMLTTEIKNSEIRRRGRTRTFPIPTSCCNSRYVRVPCRNELMYCLMRGLLTCSEHDH